MYFTASWGVLVTGVVGVAGVAGAIASAWITQYFANTRFRLERLDARYQAQREAIAEVVAVAARIVANSRVVTTSALSRTDEDGVALAVDGLQHDRVAMSLVVARAKLTVSDADVLNCLAAVDDGAGDATHSALTFVEDRRRGSGIDGRVALHTANDLHKHSNELVMTARARLSVSEHAD
ncbi:hypothetical protein [Nocardia mexicana]|uniref:hypothetical protein n=1 Tax=Nocardia mexicana TaxID=279262 RepID=UPI000832E2FB|nr:hypothetical protein [Nocardia mexicana]